MNRISGLFALVGIALSLLISPVSAASVLYGDPPDLGNGNFFPFTGDGFGANDRYQQVYDAGFFSGLSTITAITFFNLELPGAEFEEADYQLTLSTSNFGVNALDTTNLNNNPGGDAQLFAIVHLAGFTGPTFTILAGSGGGSAFVYDPSQGDLLVDIVPSNVITGTGFGALDARNGTAGGQFSRAHNFGTGFEDFGLKTEFTVVPEPSSIWLATTFLCAAVGRLLFMKLGRRL